MKRQVSSVPFEYREAFGSRRCRQPSREVVVRTAADSLRRRREQRLLAQVNLKKICGHAVPWIDVKACLLSALPQASISRLPATALAQKPFAECLGWQQSHRACSVGRGVATSRDTESSIDRQVGESCRTLGVLC